MFELSFAWKSPSLEPVGPVQTRQVQGLGLGLAQGLYSSSNRDLAKVLKMEPVVLDRDEGLAPLKYPKLFGSGSLRLLRPQEPWLP